MAVVPEDIAVVAEREVVHMVAAMVAIITLQRPGLVVAAAAVVEMERPLPLLILILMAEAE